MKIDVDWHETDLDHHLELHLEDADGRLVMIETTAISSGTKASSEANTKASTIRAPKPPSTDSRNTLGPPAPPVWLCSASTPVT